MHPTYTNPNIWKRMMMRYGMLMLMGIVVLAIMIPMIQGTHATWMLGIMLLGGLAAFSGFFGIAVSLFFHLWHGKASK